MRSRVKYDFTFTCELSQFDVFLEERYIYSHWKDLYITIMIHNGIIYEYRQDGPFNKNMIRKANKAMNKHIEHILLGKE